MSLLALPLGVGVVAVEVDFPLYCCPGQCRVLSRLETGLLCGEQQLCSTVIASSHHRRRRHHYHKPSSHHHHRSPPPPNHHRRRRRNLRCHL